MSRYTAKGIECNNCGKDFFEDSPYNRTNGEPHAQIRRWAKHRGWVVKMPKNRGTEDYCSECADKLGKRKK